MSTRNVILPTVTLVIGLAVHPAGAGTVARMSLTNAGLQANGTATSATARAVSADGRLAVFHSNSTNLVPGDTNAVTDIFVRDRVAGTTTRVSLSSTGQQGNGSSFNPALAAGGTAVAFESAASLLVAGDTNAQADVFVRDLVLGTTTRVSVASDGTQANGASSLAGLSADGQLVVFRSTATNLVGGDTNGQADVFVHDRQTGTTTRVSVAPDGTQGNGASTNPGLSEDGRLVVFESNASNLVAADTNAVADLFVHDRQTGETTRVSVDAGGGEAAGASTTPAISSDGRFVAYRSAASDLVPGDTNGVVDVFVHDRGTGAVERVSVATDGSQANGASAMPALSADGSWVAFQSAATNLVAGDTNGQLDLFLRVRATGATLRASLGPLGVQANGTSSAPSLAGDGPVVVFNSTAGNLVSDDTATGAEVFAWVPACGDGLPDPDEPCDDGNAVDGDGCDTNCTPTGCGNGVVTAGESCDDGNLVDGDGCDGNCTATGCGNGVVTAGESCDDGNAVDGDGCDTGCVPTACGNGIVTAGEGCDDGNLVDGDGCDGNCTPTSCGNGVVTAGEACDDGNLVDGDGCDTGCVPSLCDGGMPVRDARVAYERLGGVPGDEQLVLRGTLVLPPGVPRGWGGMVRGARVQLVDLGVPEGVLVDMTQTMGAGRPADEARVCPGPRAGWRRRGAARGPVHRARGGRSRSVCRAESPHGTLVLRFIDRHARLGEVEFVVALRRARLEPPVGPLRAMVVLQAQVADGRAATCGTVTLTSCSADPTGAAVTCR